MVRLRGLRISGIAGQAKSPAERIQCHRRSRWGFKATPWRQSLASSPADFHLRRATDGKDRCVSRQARRADLGGLSVGLSCLVGGTGAATAAGTSGKAGASCTGSRNQRVFIDNGHLPRSFWQGRLSPWVACITPCGAGRGQSGKSLVPSHSAVQLHRRATACSPNPVKIASLCFGERRGPHCQSRPAGHTPRVSLSIYWFHVSIFFPQQNVRRT